MKVEVLIFKGKEKTATEVAAEMLIENQIKGNGVK